MDPFKTVTNEYNILNLTEGNIAVIPCELPNGNPRPIPIFSLDNNQIEIDSNSSMQIIKISFEKTKKKTNLFFIDRYKLLPSGNLHIIDVKSSDAGKYQCSAKNSVTGQIVNNSQITILHIANKPSNNKDRLPLTTVYKPPVASR